MKDVKLKNREETLRKAYDHLKLASILIYQCASGVEPFRVSKILNMMGKTLMEEAMVLSVILGILEPEDWNPELKTRSVNLLLAELKDRGIG